MKDKIDFIEKIRKTFLFSDLKEEEFIMLTKNSTEVYYNSGELIYKQGSHCTHGQYLLDGFAKVFIEGKSQHSIVKIIKPDWFIGLLSVFSYDSNQFSASAIEYCMVRSIRKEAIQELVISNSLFAHKYIKEVSLLATDLAKYLVLKYQKNVRGRLADILLHLSENIYKSNSFNLDFTRKELGDLANTSTESIIRMLSDFRKSGIISFENHRIIINNEVELRKESEMGW